MDLNIMTVSHLFSLLNRTTTYKAIISGGKQKNSSELPVSNNDFVKRVSGFWKYKTWKKYFGTALKEATKTKIQEEQLPCTAMSPAPLNGKAMFILWP